MRTITVLHVPDCVGGRAAVEIASAIAAARADVTVEEIIVRDARDGSARCFRGSPTVLVDGRDVETDPQAPLGSMG